MAESIRAQIVALGPGETVSRAHRFRLGELDPAAFRAEDAKLRSLMQPHVKRASAETRKRYRIEGGHWITRSGCLILNVVVSLDEEVGEVDQW